MVDGGQHDIVEVAAGDTLVKTGHSKLISIIETQKGDRSWEVVCGVNACGTTLFTVSQNATAPIIINGVNKVFPNGIFIDNTVAGTGGAILVVFD